MPLGARQRERTGTEMDNHEMGSCDSITPSWEIPEGKFILGISGKGMGSAGHGGGLLCFSSSQVRGSWFPPSLECGRWEKFNCNLTFPRPWRSFEAKARQMSHPCMWPLLQGRDGLSFLPPNTMESTGEAPSTATGRVSCLSFSSLNSDKHRPRKGEKRN